MSNEDTVCLIWLSIYLLMMPVIFGVFYILDKAKMLPEAIKGFHAYLGPIFYMMWPIIFIISTIVSLAFSIGYLIFYPMKKIGDKLEKGT